MRATVRVPFYNDDYINRRIEAQSTSFEVLRGKISAIITDDEIEEYRNGNITLASKMSAAIQTVDGFQQQVSDLHSEYNAATGEFATLTSKVSEWQQTVNGFRQTVSSYEKSESINADNIKGLTDDLSSLSDNLIKNYTKTSQLVSQINQSAQQIDLSVVNTSTLYTKTDVDNKLKDYTKTSGIVAYIENHKSDLKLTDTNIVAKVTGSKAWGDNAQKVADLETLANSANTLASQAQSLASVKNTTYYASSAPTGSTNNPLKTGDLWFNSSTLALKRYNGYSWVAVDNKQIAQAVAAAATAQSTADGKIKTYSQTNAPVNNSTDPLDIGDLWIDTDDNNKLYRWNGSNWINVRDAGIAAANELAAQATKIANNKVATYYTTETPSNPTTGDLWIDSTTDSNGKKANVLKRYNGSTWVKMDSPYILEAYKNAETAQATADKKIMTFLQAEAPTGTANEPLDEGDFWIDSKDGNKLYRYNKKTKKWIDVQDEGIAYAAELATKAQELAETKITTYTGTTEPNKQTYPNLKVGDLWFTTESYKPDNLNITTTRRIIKRYTGSSWTKLDDQSIVDAYKAAATAQATADDKIQSFFQISAPANNSANNLDEGDLWVDTDDNNRMYVWNKTKLKWEPIDGLLDDLAKWKTEAEIELTEESIRQTITTWNNGAKEIVNMINQDTSGTTIKASKIKLEAKDEITLAIAAKPKVFRQSTQPTGTTTDPLHSGDIWYDTANSNRTKIFNGSGWVLADNDKVLDSNVVAKINASQEKVSISGKKIELTANSDIVNAINAKGRIFRQASAPVQSTVNNIHTIHTGDMWYDTSNSNRCYVWTGSSWDPEKLIARINLDDDTATISANKINLTAGSAINLMVTGKNAVFTQKDKPTTRTYNSTTKMYDINKGDIWYDTGNNYKMYVCTTVSGNTAYWSEAIGDKVAKTGIIDAIRTTSETTKIQATKLELTAGSELVNKLNDGQSKAKVFYTSSKPTQSTTNGIANIKAGDFWVNTATASQDMYMWNGSQWVPDKIVARINASGETAKIAASKVNITAKDLGIDADTIRMSATKIRWTSKYSTLTEDGIFTSTNNATSPSTVKLHQEYLEFTRTGTNIGHIGTNVMKRDSNYKGLVFDLKSTGQYMAWAADTDTSDTDYEIKWIYAKKAFQSYKADTLNALVPLYTKQIIATGNISAPGYLISTYDSNAINNGAIRGHHRANDGTVGITADPWVMMGSTLAQWHFKDGLLVAVG